MTRRINRPINFNPRTREGCDKGIDPSIFAVKHFNPRTREGCDRPAPPFGTGADEDFNPRTREGCDSKHSQSLACLYSFITAYFTGFYKHPTHTKRGNGKKI
ncbi:MAG: hypothetical protein ACLSF7_13415 [Acutalibacteraceae bacterium]